MSVTLVTRTSQKLTAEDRDFVCVFGRFYIHALLYASCFTFVFGFCLFSTRC